MTAFPAAAHLVLAATSKSSSSSGLLTLLPLVAIGLLGYFFFIRPQQRKAQAARQAQGSGYEVGDEVQTVGGVIGTILEVHGDRYTLLTGALGDDGNLDGPQPTRIVFVRQAIAKKIEPVEVVQVDDEPVEDVRPRTNGAGGATGVNGARGAKSSSNGAANSAGSTASGGTEDEDVDDIDDVGGDGAASSGDLGGEAEEA
jgi:preprotein translocase YajC subunit